MPFWNTRNFLIGGWFINNNIYTGKPILVFRMNSTMISKILSWTILAETICDSSLFLFVVSTMGFIRTSQGGRARWKGSGGLWDGDGNMCDRWFGKRVKWLRRMWRWR